MKIKPRKSRIKLRGQPKAHNSKDMKQHLTLHPNSTTNKGLILATTLKESFSGTPKIGNKISFSEKIVREPLNEKIAEQLVVREMTKTTDEEDSIGV